MSKHIMLAFVSPVSDKVKNDFAQITYLKPKIILEVLNIDKNAAINFATEKFGGVKKIITKVKGTTTWKQIFRVKLTP